MRITRVQAIQAHPVPDRVYYPNTDYPFSAELFYEPEIVFDYESEYAEDGSNFQPGATEQNNYAPPKIYICKHCHERVHEDDVEEHVCED